MHEVTGTTKKKSWYEVVLSRRRIEQGRKHGNLSCVRMGGNIEDWPDTKYVNESRHYPIDGRTEFDRRTDGMRPSATSAARYLNKANTDQSRARHE